MSCYDYNIESKITTLSAAIFDSMLDNYEDIFDSKELDEKFTRIGDYTFASYMYQFYPDRFYNRMLRFKPSLDSFSIQGVIRSLNSLSDDDMIDTLDVLCNWPSNADDVDVVSNGDIDIILSKLKNDQIRLLYTSLLNDSKKIPENVKMMLILSQQVGRTKLKRAMYTYRGLKISTNQLDELEIGGIYKDSGFQSTTVSPVTSKASGYRDWETDRKSTRLNSSHSAKSRMPSSA